MVGSAVVVVNDALVVLADAAVVVVAENVALAGHCTDVIGIDMKKAPRLSGFGKTWTHLPSSLTSATTPQYDVAPAPARLL